MRPCSSMRLMAVVFCGALVMGGFARRASATVLVPVDLEELVTDARAIVHGRVVSTTAQWLEGRRGIETLVTLATEDALKGGVRDGYLPRPRGPDGSIPFVHARRARLHRGR